LSCKWLSVNLGTSQSEFVIPSEAFFAQRGIWGSTQLFTKPRHNKRGLACTH
jgi:hypothetical protein